MQYIYLSAIDNPLKENRKVVKRGQNRWINSSCSLLFSPPQSSPEFCPAAVDGKDETPVEAPQIHWGWSASAGETGLGSRYRSAPPQRSLTTPSPDPTADHPDSTWAQKKRCTMWKTGWTLIKASVFPGKKYCAMLFTPTEIMSFQLSWSPLFRSTKIVNQISTIIAMKNVYIIVSEISLSSS